MEHGVGERARNEYHITLVGATDHHRANDDANDTDRALDVDSDESDDIENPRLRRERRRRRRSLRLTDADERRVSLYLVMATIAFLVCAMGIGAANYYSPLACFGQRRYIDDADRPYATPADHRHSWIVLSSAFFACGTTTLVAIGFLIVGAIGCLTLGLRISRALACSF
ncbi:hypothetical protein pmac_cds_248 [Pandoravirus macleodensis]|uniref:Uncharacterized protein n=1 Tax=Pandoravirus macleodensis TaxID=2107707 RepID=A0A2U7UER4_9VIRU|nr:hypothetical protein pmac_cds_248 [Pandoravirus macleodensis]AVK76936.1 hypothetical protein pmac_cds_248 [Pandoravirus macleodensis]UMO79568.1 hypothetical protein [Pandoravirus aubagnensis]